MRFSHEPQPTSIRAGSISTGRRRVRETMAADWRVRRSGLARMRQPAVSPIWSARTSAMAWTWAMPSEVSWESVWPWRRPSRL